MQFALNWSPEAAELLEQGDIQIDLYKCPDWENLIKDAQSQCKSYVHFPLVIGTGQHETWEFDNIHRWLETTATRFVNCHIMPHNRCFDADITVSELAKALTSEVQQLVDEFGAERVIIENCPFYKENEEKGYLTQGSATALFHEIINATGCGFLLDMAHAVIVCNYLNWNFEDYIASLPVTHIKEFHITGIGQWSNGITGDHMPLKDDDWKRLNFCLDNFRSGNWNIPDVIAFEYGGIETLKEIAGSERDVIATQTPQLYELAHSLVEN